MNKLKLTLITASIMRSLNYFEQTEEIVLIVNASFQEWKAMLQQTTLNSKNQHFVWYESELWNKQETRYDAEKRECKDLMKTLKKIHYWLYDTKFIIEIDVNILMTQLNQSASDLSEALMTRWLAWIRLFDFDVHYVFNRKHNALNELLRRFRESSDDEDETHEKDIDDFINAQLNFIHLCSVSIIVEEDMSILKDSYSEYFKKIARYLIFLSRSFEMSTKEFRKFKHEALKFMIQDKHLFKRFNKTASVWRMMNLQEERSNILQKLHDESDHRERKKTYRKMIDRYWWKKIWKNTCTYVKFCEECQLQASRRKKKILHSIWISKVWKKIEMNVIHMSSNEEKRYIVLTRNDFSRWIKERVLKAATLKAIAKFLWEDVICRHDCSKRFVMNEESKNKEIVETLIEKYKIKRVMMSTYHSQMNDLVKRDHTAVVNVLIKMTVDESMKWIRSFVSVLWADRIIVRTFTEMTSYRVLYDCDVVLSIELDVSIWQILSWNNVHTTDELLTLRAQQLECRDENLKKITLHLRRMREIDKDVWNDHRHVHTSSILKNDLVLLHDIKLNNMHTLKLTWRWLRSFQVVKMNTEKEWYKIAELDEAILKETIAENRLKKRVNWASKSEISNEQKNKDQNLSMTTLIEKIVSEIAINVSIRNSNASLNFIHY